MPRGESAKSVRESVEAVAMPYVMGAKPGFALTRSSVVQGGGSEGRLDAVLWNLGSGPGIVTNVRLIRPGESYLQELSGDIPIAAGSLRRRHTGGWLAAHADEGHPSDRVSALPTAGCTGPSRGGPAALPHVPAVLGGGT